MNRHDTVTGLVSRGYPPSLSDLAVKRAARTGRYDLTRHVVTLTGDAEYAITPSPWEGEGEPGSTDGWPHDIAGILEIIQAVDAWLDAAVAGLYQGQPLGQDWARTAKTVEEIGEAQEELDAMALAAAQARVASLNVPAGKAVAALIAVTGQNPRKGVHGTKADLVKELADVACTALFAIQHFTKDADTTWLILLESLAKARSRVPADQVFPPEHGTAGEPS